MAEMSTKCPHCGAEMTIQSEWIGMNAKCPGCKNDFLINPSSAAVNPTPIAPAPIPQAANPFSNSAPAMPPPPANPFSNSAPAMPPPPANPYQNCAERSADAINVSSCNWYISREDAQQVNSFFTTMWICFLGGFVTFGISVIVGLVFMYILLYKFWKFIPRQENPNITPQRAVGFCFIPFFNFYWNFITFRKLAAHYKPYTSAPIEIYAWLYSFSFCAVMYSTIAILIFPILLFDELRKIATAISLKNNTFGNNQYRNY